MRDSTQLVDMTGRLRILIVDDDPADARGLQEQLLRHGTAFETRIVATRQAAADALAAGEIDAVLLDMHLEGAKGATLVRELRDVAPAVPVVALTGTDDQDRSREAIRAGAQECLPKPGLDPSLLSRAVRHAIERHQVVEERLRAEARLGQAERMEAVARLAGGVAHDFNNLLTVIDNYGELLLDELADHPSASESVAEILTASKQASTLTRQLLQFSRRRPSRPKVLALNHQIERIRGTLERLLGTDLRLHTDLSADDPRVSIDPSGLDQVIFNLAVNARDAMTPGGRLTLETDRCPTSDGTKAWAVLRVIDTGEGIPPEVLPQVCEPFFTTKDPERGAGLGLSACHGIVAQAGGEITIHSRVGKGTTVEILLPAVDEPAEAQPASDEPRSPYGSETVLVVEDEPRVRALAVRALKRYGYAALDAPDGDSALALCADEIRKIDLVLSDVVMPGIPGPHLVEKLRAMRPGLKVLYMSGYSRDVVANPPRLDAPFLVKPFAPEQLAQAVRAALDARS